MYAASKDNRRPKDKIKPIAENKPTLLNRRWPRSEVVLVEMAIYLPPGKVVGLPTRHGLRPVADLSRNTRLSSTQQSGQREKQPRDDHIGDEHDRVENGNEKERINDDTE